MFKIIVEKHIKCIKVCDLWKIVRSVISRAAWWPCFKQIKYILAIFVEDHLVTISAKSISVLTIGFREEV